MRIEIIYCYPQRKLDLDLNNSKYKLMLNNAIELYEQILKITTNFENKLLNNIDLVEKYLQDERCTQYRRYISLILRKSKHPLKDECSKIEYEKTLQSIKSKYQALFNNGFEIKQLSLGDKTVDLNRFNYYDLMIDDNQLHRKIIFDAYTEKYAKCNEILANLYLAKLKNDISLARQQKKIRLLLLLRGLKNLV